MLEKETGLEVRSKWEPTDGKAGGQRESNIRFWDVPEEFEAYTQQEDIKELLQQPDDHCGVFRSTPGETVPWGRGGCPIRSYGFGEESEGTAGVTDVESSQ